MLRSNRFYAPAFIGLGMLLGYAAASGKLNPFGRADAAPSGDPTAAKPADDDGCCCDGADKARLLAAADPKVRAAVRKLEDKGKKPNIVVIMGDDIGVWNIGAYHRGMMAGRTPHLDQLAKEGMLFTDYYAEASCTAGRAN